MAVFIAICANGLVDTIHDSSVNQGHGHATLYHHVGKGVISSAFLALGTDRRKERIRSKREECVYYRKVERVGVCV